MFRKRKKSHERKQYNSGEGNYKGEMKDNMRHGCGTDDGYGTYTFINGDVYTGSWEDDCPNGSGTLKYASGAVYTGEWRDGQRHGKCTFTWTNGDIYEGSFLHDKVQSGKCRYTNDDVYEGGFVGILEEWGGCSFTLLDTGTYTCANGDVYEKKINYGKGRAHGTLKYACGDIYEGNFVDGMPDGEGSLKCKTGDEYAGKWTTGAPHSTIFCKYVNGNIGQEEYEYGKLVSNKLVTVQDLYKLHEDANSKTILRTNNFKGSVNKKDEASKDSRIAYLTEALEQKEEEMAMLCMSRDQETITNYILGPMMRNGISRDESKQERSRRMSKITIALSKANKMKDHEISQLKKELKTREVSWIKPEVATTLVKAIRQKDAELSQLKTKLKHSKKVADDEIFQLNTKLEGSKQVFTNLVSTVKQKDDEISQNVVAIARAIKEKDDEISQLKMLEYSKLIDTVDLTSNQFGTSSSKNPSSSNKSNLAIQHEQNQRMVQVKQEMKDELEEKQEGLDDQVLFTNFLQSKIDELAQLAEAGGVDKSKISEISGRLYSSV